MRYIPDAYLKEFNARVWEHARQVPLGKVATYGQLAKLQVCPNGLSIDKYREFSARWVGNAMADCPRDVPWQRIVNAQGKVSKRVEANRQRELLEREGICFVDDALDLKRYQWQQDEEEQLSQGSLF